MGCNVHMGVASNRVYRYVPRRNDAVNETWMCDEGRLSYKTIEAAHRQREALVRGDGAAMVAAPMDVAVAAAARCIGSAIRGHGAASVASIASAHATNEDLFVLRRLLDGLQIEARGLVVPRGRADDLLMKEEKAANAAGARALGFGEAGGIADGVRSGVLRALLVLGHDVLELLDTAALDRLDALIVLDTHQSPLQRVASVVLPARHAAEKLGTLTNVARRVQRVRPAVEPTFVALAEGEILHRIGQALGLPEFEASWDAASVSKAIGEVVPTFAGIHLDSVGDEGLCLLGEGAP
jgi:NADH-quinone oxidoreductase subunit G